MDVSLIMKSRNVFPANTGTFVYVFLVVTRENTKMKYSDCEVISHYVPFYSDTDWLGKVGLFFICYRVVFIQIVSQIDRETFSSRLLGILSKSLRRPLLRPSWMRCPGESTSRSSPNFKLGSCSLAFAIIYQQQNSMVVK